MENTKDKTTNETTTNITDNKKKKVNLAPIIFSLIALAVVGYFILNWAAGFHEGKAKRIMMDEISPRVEMLKEETGWDEMYVRIDMTDIYVKEEGLFASDTEVSGDIGIIVTVPEVQEALDNEEYSEELCEKATSVRLCITSEELTFGKYEFKGTYRTYYIDSKGLKYDIQHDCIMLDNDIVYRTPDRIAEDEEFEEWKDENKSNSGSSSKSCEYCGGSGKRTVKWYSEGDWGETSYTSSTCTYCNGTGKR